MKIAEFSKKKCIFLSNVSRAVKTEEGSSRKLVKIPFLTVAIKFKLLKRSKEFLKNLKNNISRIIFLSDEKTFNVNLVFNKHNDRVFSFGQDVYVLNCVTTRKYPVLLIMLGVVGSTGKNAPV